MSDVEKNVWQLISDALTEAGIDNYPPGIKKGTCKKEYVVFKQDGGSQINNISSEVVYYVFMLYVPQNKYSFLSDFEAMVKKVLDEKIYPTIIQITLYSMLYITKSPTYCSFSFRSLIINLSGVPLKPNASLILFSIYLV